MRKPVTNLSTTQHKTRKQFSEDNPVVNFALNASLITEIRQWLELRSRQGYIDRPSLSWFVRRALHAHQAESIQLDWDKRPVGIRTNITVRLSLQSFNHYVSLPLGKRVAILELSLLSYYQFKKQENT